MFAIEGVGPDPIRATGALLLDLPWAVRGMREAGGRAFWLRPRNPQPQDAWELFQRAADRLHTDANSLYEDVRVSDEELTSPVPYGTPIAWPSSAEVRNPVELAAGRLHSRLVPDEPELHVIKLPDLLGDEWRAERARQAEESRSKYREHVADALGGLDLAASDVGVVADAVLDALFVIKQVDGGGTCSCSCHPHLPSRDQHDYGFDCSCRHTAAENSARWRELFADMDAFWRTPEGVASRAREAQEEAELDAWLAANPGVTVATRGGFAPEQWRGEVDGHAFFFRERHDLWRIEVDLRPSGRFYRVFTGTGDLDDDGSFEERESEEGDVIAEGTTATHGYGTRPVERAQFIVGMIRDHLRRVRCTVHDDERGDLELACGRPLNWCPACGACLHGGRPWEW